MKRTHIIILIVSLLLVAAVVGAGIIASDDADIAPKPSASDAAASSDGGAGGSDAGESAAGDPLPEFTGELFGGGTLSTADIEGPAVIHVFGSWCPTCQGEAAAFAKLQKEHPDLNYYFIAVQDSEGAARQFFEDYGWKSGPIINDADREVESEFGLGGQPHTIFVDADGNTTTHQGPGSFGDLDMKATAIAGEPAA